MVDAVYTFTFGYLAQAAVALIMAAILWRFHSHYRRAHLTWWALGWGLLAMHLVCGACANWMHTFLGPRDVLRSATSFAGIVAGYWQLAFLLFGTFEFTRGKNVSPRRVRQALTGLGLVSLVVLIGTLWTDSWWRLLFRVGLGSLASGIAYLIAARAFVRVRRDAGLGRNMAFIGFVTVGLFRLQEFVVLALGKATTLPPLYALVMSYGGCCFLAFLGISMIAWLLEGERDRLVTASAALKRTEDQLRHAQKMEAVGILAGGIAHDFNNLLTVMMGYVENAARSAVDSGVRSDIENIRGAAERAAMLTTQLLAFSRKQPQQPKILDLNAVVNGLEKFLRRLIGEDIRFVTRLERDLAHVKVDQGQIEQVIVNLVVNSRDALPNGGEIAIETANHDLPTARRIGPDEMAAGEWVRLTVRDSGCGMDEATRQHIFEPFFTTKEPGKGTGLGLAVVYGIVTQSRGAIDLESAVGKGTAFHVFLPRTVETPAPTEPQRRRRTSARAREMILLVEDEPMVRQLCHRVLTSRGYRVLVASNGEEAMQLSAAHAGPIDLLITDIVMPGINGRDLADRLRPARPEMDVLLMSGYPDRVPTRRALIDDRVSFLEKPFTPDRLLSRVQEILDISGYQRRVQAQGAV